jgi:ParB/RepB/Spo0J family partition protein
LNNPGLHEAVVLPIDSLHPVEWNPNEEDVATFNNLVESIKEEGFIDPVTVVPIPKSKGEYGIIRGEHRWKAAKLAGLDTITAVVVDWSEDEQMARSIRHNVIRGRLDPAKFSDVYGKLAKKYDRTTLAAKLGMQHQEKTIERLLGNIVKTLPPEMADEVLARADKIRNVEDLAAIVQSLYARFGSTLDASYMFLTFGGQVHVMIRLDDDTKQKLDAALDRLHSEGKDANDLIRRALEAVV